MPDPQVIQPSKGLYYPNLDFKSAAWVKSALLYWDGIVRVRSTGTAPQDDREIQQIVEAGLIEEAWVEPRRRSVTPEFGRRVDTLVRAHSGRLPPSIPKTKPALGDTPELIRKVRQQVYDDLHEYPVARDALWNGDEEQARTLFFSFFLEHHANALGLAPATDEPMFTALGTYFAEEEVTPDPGQLSPTDGSAIAQLALPVPSVEALAELSVERLLGIRQKYADQRHRFREKVQTKLSTVRDLRTPQEIQEHLNSLQQEIQEDLEAAREAVKDSKAKERWTTLGITAPAWMAASEAVAMAAGGPVLAPVAGIGTLALGMTSWFMRSRKGSSAQSHYLLSLDTAAKDPWHRLGRAFRELVKG
jgi:hypothetical protein